MKRRYVLAPEAALDLVGIRHYLRLKASVEIADRVESAIREKMAFLAHVPGAGHRRLDLTSLPLKFFRVYSYLIVYKPETRPLEIVAILHGYRDVERVLALRR